jgi:hypothetical protein
MNFKAVNNIFHIRADDGHSYKNFGPENWWRDLDH